jgi:hypothetical protein
VSNVGYVYIFGSRNAPQWIKIGYTTRSPEDRAAEMERYRGISGPFEVLWKSRLLRDAPAAERHAFRALAAVRLGNTELFEVSGKVAARQIEAVLFTHCPPASDAEAAEHQRRTIEARRKRQEHFARIARQEQLEEERREREARREEAIRRASNRSVWAMPPETARGWALNLVLFWVVYENEALLLPWCIYLLISMALTSQRIPK